MAKKIEMSDILEDVKPKTVKLKQFRKEGWLPEGHDGEYRFTGTAEVLTVQRHKDTGVYVTGLTEEDEKRLEKSLNKTPGTLSRHNKDFWGKFFIKIPRSGMVLYLDNAEHELMWLVCKAHQFIANSEEDKLYTPFARYVMTSEEEIEKKVNDKFELKSKAFAKYSTMSLQEQIDFLRVYGKNPGAEPRESFIRSQISKVIEDEPKKFLEIMEDKGYKTKVFLKECVAKNIVLEKGTKFVLQGGDVIGYTLDQAIEYLKNPENQEVLIMLKGQLEVSK